MAVIAGTMPPGEELEINLMTAQVSALGHAIRAIVGKRPSTAVTTGGICAISGRTRKERPRRDSDQRVRRAAQEMNEQNSKRADRRVGVRLIRGRVRWPGCRPLTQTIVGGGHHDRAAEHRRQHHRLRRDRRGPPRRPRPRHRRQPALLPLPRPGAGRAGYRVANVDIRGCGDSSLGWDGYSRTDIAGDLVAARAPPRRPGRDHRAVDQRRRRDHRRRHRTRADHRRRSSWRRSPATSPSTWAGWCG